MNFDGFEVLHIFFNLSTSVWQLMIDVGSSTVATGVVSLVLGYLNNLVIEMAFVIQVKTRVNVAFN